ncbi:sensor histidine kinase [Sphingomonas sp. HMP6]|uniref:sensor histidine kinase n=1 Tax=Sphingomonas sp. HMP6 TaxID=1517551 RepID=UPI001596D691|nr:HAMP domain-containing sensor histidine kinase [Sphingomonas sp. HMP6]BCA58843.1 two-component system sensor histidine kinase [Sphingomonas sp. HMP6]
MALLIAVALFVAQAINFSLLLSERRQARLDQATGPVVTRIIDADERIHAGRAIGGGNWSRVQLAAASPVMPAGQHVPEVEAALRGALSDAGVRVRRIQTQVIPIKRNDPRLRYVSKMRVERLLRAGAELMVAVERTDGQWLILNLPWSRNDAAIFWRLIAQTLILYGVALVPLLWAARRISRPLRSLATAARAFQPGAAVDPVAARGPQDVRDVIVAFNALRLRVTAMLDEKDRMLGAIGHDLRTPLAALRVRIESVEDEDDRVKMADTIAEMNSTLDDILSLARLGRPSEPPTEVDLAALVDAVVEDFRDLGSNIVFEEAARLKMRLRPGLMRRAVRNLIENALKYAGAAEVTVTAEARSVVIAVCDRGPGIPPDRLGDVFEAFTRIETSRNKETGGIGLGLALARTIVRDAGGDITLENRDGGGLVARIVLVR